MICRLSKLPEDSYGLYGPKAASLGKLAANGMNVPEGYAISYEVFEHFLEYNGFRFDSDRYMSHNDEIIAFILEAKLPPELGSELKKIYGILRKDDSLKLAVRSSALCEDTGEHSMAGMYSSYINLSSFEEVEEAVKKCYASLFSDRALVAAVRNGLELSRLRMGVIVQEFVPGSPSGVIFTADTVNMDPGKITINAVNGFCADYVNSLLPPALYAMDKTSSRITESHVPDGAPTPDRCNIPMLYRAASDIERIFGSYQDIEWTIKNGELYILQARPVTTFRKAGVHASWLDFSDSEHTWARDELNEGPLTPLQQDIVAMNNACADRGREASGRGKYHAMVKNGYLYYYLENNNAEKRKAFRTMLDQMALQGRNIFQDVVLPQLLQYRNLLNSYIDRDISQSELLCFLDRALEFSGKAVELHIISADAGLYLNTFEIYCRKLFEELSQDDFYDLVYEDGWLFKERDMLIRIADFVKSDKTLSDLFEKQFYDEIVYARLTRYPVGLELLNAISGYMKLFGVMLAKGQMQLGSPVMLENPAEVIRKLRTFLSVDSDSFFKVRQQRLANKERLTRFMLDRLSLQERDNFRIMLMAAEKAFLANDDHCYYIDLTSPGYLRLALKKAGEFLVGEGMLESWKDVFFLRLNELKGLLCSRNRDFKEVIGERKLEFEQRRMLVPPPFLGKPPAQDAVKNDGREVGKLPVLSGVSGIRKKVRGRVRVIRNNAEALDISDERILVLRHGHGCYLMPLLDRVKGLIFDEGSPFDHPGIMAREFEIPSLYYTRNASELLKDDDEVELDGINGQVIILKRSGAV